ncbi:MAG: type I restriction enzyme, S subunit [Desulfobacteraceae bacterium Eth-SRB1]|nr:MAG: type I restriction enzyme, S subunit [Desulfobacteraceae bacterium Eth-SRB1]
MTDKKLIRINKKELPEGWKVERIENLSTVILGQSPASSSYNTNEEGLPFFQGKTEFGPAYPQAVKWCTEPKKTALKNDVLISVRAPVGPTNLAPAKCCIGRGLAAIRPNDGVSYKYLLYYLRSIEAAVASLGTGTTFKAISGGILKNLPVLLAPEHEQKRIVAEIEKQFSRLDEAVENLKRVKANLKRYKASVLKAAVEGKLTEDWRKAHPGAEPADKLLERILAERRKKWEETELVKMEAKGKEPKDDKWKKKYKELPQVDGALLPALPDGWVWANLPQLGELDRGKSKHRPRNAPFLYGGPYPFVQTGDVRHATGIIKQYSQTYSEEGLKQSRLWPKETLCITIAANIADTALLGFDACFPDSIVGFIPENKNIDVRFIEYFVRTAKEDLERYAPATAQKNINLAILSDVAVSLPPEEEQHIIIDEIERCLTIAEGIEFDIEQNMVRANRLRQSILKKAFSGKLVAQDENDEFLVSSLK